VEEQSRNEEIMGWGPTAMGETYGVRVARPERHGDKGERCGGATYVCSRIATPDWRIKIKRASKRRGTKTMVATPGGSRPRTERRVEGREPGIDGGRRRRK